MKVEPTIRISGLNISAEINLQNRPPRSMNLGYFVFISIAQTLIPISVNYFQGKNAFGSHEEVITFSTGVIIQFIIYLANLVLFNLLNIMTYSKMMNMETMFTMINCYSRGYYQIKSEMPQIAMFDSQTLNHIVNLSDLILNSFNNLYQRALLFGAVILGVYSVEFGYIYL